MGTLERAIIHDVITIEVLLEGLKSDWWERNEREQGPTSVSKLFKKVNRAELPTLRDTKYGSIFLPRYNKWLMPKLTT